MIALLFCVFSTAFAHEPLRRDFRAAWTALGGFGADGVFDEVARRYAEEGRAYHTLDHVADCVAKLDESAVPREARAPALVTRTHEGATPLERLFVDIDLSILGAEPATFARFERGIRREYAWVPEAEYRRGRAAVLRKFLDRPSIFRTPAFTAAHEARARINLETLIRTFELPAGAGAR